MLTLFNIVKEPHDIFEEDTNVGDWYLNADRVLCCNLGGGDVIAFTEEGTPSFVSTLPLSNLPIKSMVTITSIEWSIECVISGNATPYCKGPWHVDSSLNLYYVTFSDDKYTIIKFIKTKGTIQAAVELITEDFTCDLLCVNLDYIRLNGIFGV